MTQEQIIGLVVTGVILLVMGVLSIIMLTGRGAFFIAGFNTMSKERQAKYDKEKLTKFIGLVLLVVTICTASMTLGFIFEITALWVISSVVFGVVIILAIIFANSKKFKKKSEADNNDQR